MTMSLLMQKRLGNFHDSLKEFPKGNPLKETFHKNVTEQRLEKHLTFLFNERELDKKFNEEEIKIIMEKQMKKAAQQLRMRGYTIIKI